MPVSRPAWLAYAAIFALAFALRVYHLDARALWWDEGLTLFFARLGFADNGLYAVRLADTNPPFYRLLAGAWTALAGPSAFALRFLSALAGLVTVAAAARLGRAWRGAPLGFAAAGLAAASPMLVYFAQEAKAYSLVAACAALACLLCARFLLRPASRRSPAAWALYSLLLLLALGSHYITIFLIAVQGAWLALVFWRGRAASGLGPLAWLCAAMLLAALAQVPYWRLTFSGTSAVVRGETGEFDGLRGPLAFFGAHLLEFGNGPGAASEGYRGNDLGAGGAALLYGAAALGLAALAVAGARRRGPLPSSFPSFLSSLLLFPLLAGFLLNAYHEFFFPRFLLYAVPPFLILAGAGWLALAQRGRPWRLAALSAGGLIFAAWAFYLGGYYAGPGEAAQAEDWRPLARTLGAHTRAGDAAIYARGWMPGYLHAYLPPAPEPAYYLAHFSPDALGPELAAIAAQHPRVWLLDYQVEHFDPRNPAGLWLGEQGALVYDEWFGHGHAALFLPAQHLLPPGAELQRTEFSNGLQLEWQPLALQAAAGDAFAFGLAWRARAGAAPERFTVFLHGLAPDGSLAFGRDSEPLNGLRPADHWAAGERVREWRGALLPPDLAPGDYTLQLGLYETLTAAPIPLRAGARALELGRLRVR